LESVGARVLGTVLNMAPTGGAHGYGYGYGYSSEYATRTDRPKLTAMEPPASTTAESGRRRASSRAS
ncbi:MAG TPA: hypothetical protein VLM05_09185, partial [Mycobacteriales bacterium]|nr:hypothetical protein [Mycobacteriales bacterium]